MKFWNRLVTAEELQKLAKTPCQDPVVKAASLFSCLTGLRRSDILQLTWEDFATYLDGGHCIRIKTEKTVTGKGTEATGSCAKISLSSFVAISTNIRLFIPLNHFYINIR